MTALATIRAAGFALRALDDGIGVTPIGELTDVQRAWIIQHRDELLTELCAEATDDAAGTTEPVRWSRFVTLCERLGLHRDAVADEFTGGDRADLLATCADDDVRLRRCAETLAGDDWLIAASAWRRQGERLKAES